MTNLRIDYIHSSQSQRISRYNSAMYWLGFDNIVFPISSMRSVWNEDLMCLTDLPDIETRIRTTLTNQGVLAC